LKIIFCQYSINHFGKLSPNVPAVCDGFAVAIKEREAFQRPQNCGGAKYHKGAAPTGILRSLAAERRRTVTDLLRLQKKYFIYYFVVFENLFLFICYFFISFIVIFFLISIQ